MTQKTKTKSDKDVQYRMAPARMTKDELLARCETLEACHDDFKNKINELDRNYTELHTSWMDKRDELKEMTKSRDLFVGWFWGSVVIGVVACICTYATATLPSGL